MPWGCHASEDHQAPGPAFEVPIPAQAPPVVPNAPDWATFDRDMRLLFQDYAVTEIPEEGPILHVITWYIHHDRVPSCILGRLVRLSHRPWEWMPLLCAPWLPLIQPFENLAFHVVKPNPTPDMAGQRIVHVILEQGLQQARMTALFSVLFHGIHGDVTHRRAQSIPTHLSREVIARILDIAELCQARRCTAWSGSTQFHRQRFDQVFQGIGVSFTVAPFRNRFAVVDDDGYVMPHAASSSQVPPRMSFRHDDATLFPAADADEAVHDQPASEHAPSRLIPQLRIIWEHYLITTTTRPYRFLVDTWFCDHDRFPRTDRSREVLLPPDQALWRQTLLDKWQDCIDSRADVLIYVVQPTPLGGASDILAHIILAQHQHCGFVSALITTIAPVDDPWDPPRVALKLPSVVDKALLIQESGLFQYCPPFLPFNDCKALHGDQVVAQIGLHDAQSGDGFLCVAEVRPSQHVVDIVAPSYFDHVHRLFHVVGQTLTSIVISLDKAVQAFPSWTREVAELLSELDCVESETSALIHAFAAGASSGDTSVLLHTHPCPGSATDKRSFQPCDASGLFDNVGWTKLWSQLCHIERTRASKGYDALSPFHVQVWYSDHLRHPVSIAAPIVALFPGQDWAQLLLQSCLPLLDRSTPVMPYLLMYPDVDRSDGVDAHVVLVQNALPGLSSIMCVSSLPDLRVILPRLRVGTVAMPLTAVHLQFALAPFLSSLHPDHANSCRFFLDQVQIGSDDDKCVTHGTCIRIEFPNALEPWSGLSDPAFAQLLQRSQPASSSVSKPRLSNPVRLSLQASLPIKPVDPKSQRFDDKLPTISLFEDQDWKQRVYDQELPCLLPLPDGLVLPPATYWAMVDDTPLDSDEFTWAEIYVDGSTNATMAAWSVVVVRTDGKASQFLGLLHGRVQQASQSSDWIGAQTYDNIAAEFTAFAIALDLACRMEPVSTVIRPDLQLSALIAAQQCVTHSNPRLAQLIAALGSWLPARATIHEVRGHSGHPWNDLADAVARWALTHDVAVSHAVPILHQLATAPADLTWTWLQGGPTSLFQALPPIVDGQVCQFPLSLRKVPVPPSMSSVPQEPSRCEIQVVSLNVLALDSLQEQRQLGRSRGHRTARLDHQWHQQQVHILGLQETRTLPGRYVTDHFMIFASGYEDASAPHFGCEVWLHRAKPLVVLPDGVGICAPDFKFAVVHADPRRLILRADHACCSFLVTVLHAPCLGKTKGNGHRPIDDIEKWWLETSTLLDACGQATYHWCCIDANAPLASHETHCFALAHAEAPNPQGLLFEDFLLRHQLAVPATFPDVHQGSSWTWTHSSGTRCRRDYVLVPVNLLSCVQESFTDSSYDGSFCHEDHIPTGIRFAAFLPGVESRARLHWDEIAFLDPVRIEQFQAALRTLPLPTWDVRTTDHCALYEEQIVQLGQQFFGGKPKRRYRPQLKPETLALIGFKRHLLDVGRAWQLMCDDDFKTELRAVEKIVRKAVYADITCFYDQLLVQLQSADSAADAKQVYRILDRLGRKKAKGAGGRPLPMLKRSDGTCVQTFQQQQAIWLKQFAATEAGVPMSWSSLYELCRPGLASQEFELDPQAFIAPWQLLQAMRKMKRGKACGPNAMPPDLVKAGGAPFAMQLSCLTNKVIAHAHEPTTWRGGKLVPLFKGKGSPHEPTLFAASSSQTLLRNCITLACGNRSNVRGLPSFTQCNLEAVQAVVSTFPITFCRCINAGPVPPKRLLLLSFLA